MEGGACVCGGSCSNGHSFSQYVSQCPPCQAVPLELGFRAMNETEDPGLRAFTLE